MFIMALSTMQCYNIGKSIVESELMIMYSLIFDIVAVVMGAAGIMKLSEAPLLTANILLLFLISWDAVRDYIRQHNDKRT